MGSPTPTPPPSSPIPPPSAHSPPPEISPISRVSPLPDPEVRQEDSILGGSRVVPIPPPSSPTSLPVSRVRRLHPDLVEVKQEDVMIGGSASDFANGKKSYAFKSGSPLERFYDTPRPVYREDDQFPVPKRRKRTNYEDYDEDDDDDDDE